MSDSSSSLKRVLVVDDNVINRRLAIAFVSRLGYTTDQAEDGPDVGAVEDSFRLAARNGVPAGFEHVVERLPAALAGEGQMLPIGAAVADVVDELLEFGDTLDVVGAGSRVGGWP